MGVLTVRDGKIARWREYQDTPAMAAALAER
jgi:ketosteroid isomerase-like protein